MSNTLAIHWAATTYGTWLHGDPRGSWRNGRLIGPDPYLEAESRARMSGQAVVLDAEERWIVAAQFGQIVRERRHRVFAAAIQATHVHLVFGPLCENIETVIARLKRRSAAAVLGRRRERNRPARMAGLYSRAILARPRDSRAILARPHDHQTILARRRAVPRSLWTAGKFPVFIFDEHHLMNVVEYVRDHNRRAALPPDPYDWVDPLYPAAVEGGERCCRSSVVDVPRF